MARNRPEPVNVVRGRRDDQVVALRPARAIGWVRWTDRAGWVAGMVVSKRSDGAVYFWWADERGEYRAWLDGAHVAIPIADLGPPGDA